MQHVLDKEQFEGAKVLAHIGQQIAAGRAALAELEAGKRDFLDGREAEAVGRVEAVLVQSKALLEECGNYHSELVSFRTQIDELVDSVRQLIQSVERWKSEFDLGLDATQRELDRQYAEHNLILTQVKAQRAFLAGEASTIKGKRRALQEEKRKIDDEWKTLERAQKEINGNK